MTSSYKLAKSGTALMLCIVLIATFFASSNNYAAGAEADPVDPRPSYVSLTGTAQYYQGATWKTAVDVSDEISFDLKFNTAPSDLSYFAITLGKDHSSFNDASKGATLLVYRQNYEPLEGNVIAMAGGEWREFPFHELNHLKLKRGTGKIELYLQNSKYANEVFVGEVAIADDFFTNNEAVLGFYFGSASDASAVTAELSDLTVNGKLVQLHADGFNLTSLFQVTQQLQSTELTNQASDWEFNSGASYNQGIVTVGKDSSAYYQTIQTSQQLAKLELKAGYNPDTWIALGLRATNPMVQIWDNDSGYFYVIDGGGNVTLFKKPSGAGMASVATASTTKLLDGEYHAIEIGSRNIGDHVQVVLFIDGTLVLSYVDQANVIQNHTGLTLLTFGNASITVRLPGASEPQEPTGPTLEELSMQPFWLGDTIYHESLLMVSHDGELPEASLMYSPTEIVAVKSATLNTEYEEGKDWKLEDGKIKLLTGTAIPYMTDEELYPASPAANQYVAKRGGGYVLLREGSYFHERQIVVTYKHDQRWQGPIPVYESERLSKTIAKLEAGEDVKILLLGDSISVGANSSGVTGAAPHLPNWFGLLKGQLEAVYDSEITTVNHAVGGETAVWGVTKSADSAKEKPDLAIIAFGMNDGASSEAAYSAASFQANVKLMMDQFRAANENVEFILVGTTLANEETFYQNIQAQYYPKLEQLAEQAGTGVAAANMTGVHEQLLKLKSFQDMTGNNVNHPNDFLARWYAQHMAGMLIESTDTTLSDIKVNGQSVTGFAPHQQSYEVQVENTVTSGNVTATAAGDGMKLAIVGDSALKVGNNPFTIRVYSDHDDHYRYYKLNILRAAASTPDPDNGGGNGGDNGGGGGGNGGGSGGSGGGSSNPEPEAGAPEVELERKETSISIGGNTIAVGSLILLEGEQGNKAVIQLVDAQLTEAITGTQNQQVVLKFPANQATVEARVSAAALEQLRQSNAELVLQTEAAQYILPAAALDLNQVAAGFGESVSPGDIRVTIQVGTPAAGMRNQVNTVVQDQFYNLIVPPTEFSISYTYNNKTIEANAFNQYVERRIAIPADRAKDVSTALIVHPDGTTSHVPTKVQQIDGQTYAVVKSMSNSTYAVVWNIVSYDDVDGHWAQDVINDLGSRGIVSGTGNNRFTPERTVTRAEFAAMLVKALGLKPTTTTAKSFDDVLKNAWHHDLIQTAVAYELIQGVSDRAFDPNAPITREQAVVMLTRAMRLTGLSTSLASNEAASVLSGYTDARAVSAYAESSMTIGLKQGIVTGKAGQRLAPQDWVTRAETAVLIHRLLMKSDLI